MLVASDVLGDLKAKVMNFIPRVLSAAVALAIFIGVFLMWNVHGLKALIFLAVFIGAWELVKILFRPDDSRLNRVTFYFFLICIFTLSTLHPSHSGLIFSFFSICFCLVSLMTQKKFESLEALTSFQAKSILGFFYVGLLPVFALRLIELPYGILWFFTLLAVVFAGDIGAYLTGMMWGRRKLMPLVSPKKTVEGAAGGLTASVLAGALMAQRLEQPTLYLVLLSAAAAVAAQFGDLFESQLKRVADVKDSGRIMPGHGGILDRIDGVLFASPILLFGALLLENRFV